jgi:transcription antitermination factor NusG
LLQEYNLINVNTTNYESEPPFPNLLAGQFEGQWFALRVKSNFERTTTLHLRQRGYQGFLPTYTTHKRWSDRIKTVEKPLFPGYVFSNFDPNRRLPILTTPGVLHIVGFGKEPLPIDTNELEAVWATLRSGVLVRPWPYLQVGERVTVERGPLAGVEGLVQRLKGAFRLVVSITILQRSIAAEVDREWIRPVRSAVCGRAANN